MDPNLVETVHQRLKKHEETISKSEFFERSVSALKIVPFSRIHCLALGSPTLEFQALYQLAYLRLLAERFNVDSGKIEVFDPVFDSNDNYLLETVLGYRVADVRQKEDSAVTLFYMPHAPRSLTNRFIADIEPRWILGNDVTVTMGTLGKVKFLADYPTLATLVHLAQVLPSSETTKPPADEFQVASGRRRGKRKNVYVEPKCEYDLAQVYFDGIMVERLTSPGNAPWKDSFSDLALNTITAKPERETQCI